MKKEYIVPEIEVITFDDGDVLTGSLLYNVGGTASSDELNFNWSTTQGTVTDSFTVKSIINQSQNQ